jgi:hypothetical protein
LLEAVSLQDIQYRDLEDSSGRFKRFNLAELCKEDSYNTLFRYGNILFKLNIFQRERVIKSQGLLDRLLDFLFGKSHSVALYTVETVWLQDKDIGEIKPLTYFLIELWEGIPFGIRDVPFCHELREAVYEAEAGFPGGGHPHVKAMRDTWEYINKFLSSEEKKQLAEFVKNVLKLSYEELLRPED